MVAAGHWPPLHCFVGLKKEMRRMQPRDSRPIHLELGRICVGVAFVAASVLPPPDATTGRADLDLGMVDRNRERAATSGDNC
jgi:hypothetical protein